MHPLIATLAFLLVSAFTYSLFQILGNRPTLNFNNALSRDEYLTNSSMNLIRTQGITSIAGTLTSFGTVFLFYLSNTYHFGLLIIAVPASLLLSPAVTNYFTRRIKLRNERWSTLSENKSAAVLPSLAWSNTSRGHSVSSIIKYVSLLNIFGVIWLEFSLFADFFSQLVGANIFISMAFLFVISFLIIWFTFSYGIRGFIFADVVQTPLIFIGSLFILFGITLYINNTQTEFGYHNLSLSPEVPKYVWIIFLAHVFILNPFFQLVSEPHWLRLWTFKEIEISQQFAGVLVTVILAAPLILAGALGSHAVSDGATFSVAKILQILAEQGFIYELGFWIAASAALFSTADSMLYSFYIVWKFNTKDGSYNERQLNPLLAALILSVPLSIAYFIVRYFGQIPVDKLIYAIVPFAITILPAIVDLSMDRSPKILTLSLSILFYIFFTMIGWLMPADEYLFNLAAIFIPTVIALLSFAFNKKMEKVR